MTIKIRALASLSALCVVGSLLSGWMSYHVFLDYLESYGDPIKLAFGVFFILSAFALLSFGINYIVKIIKVCGM